VPAQQPLLICFDGSEGAANAITETARLFPGEHVVIVYVQGLPSMYITDYAAPPISADIVRQAQEAAETHANETVEHGKTIARKAGLDPDGFAFTTSSSVWRRILEAADDVQARVIVAGSRGRGEVKSLVLGSISQALAHHSTLPLLIVPYRD
jgi:nucleotide-binding universal stress UspA family protein